MELTVEADFHLEKEVLIQEPWFDFSGNGEWGFSPSLCSRDQWFSKNNIKSSRLLLFKVWPMDHQHEH